MLIKFNMAIKKGNFGLFGLISEEKQMFLFICLFLQ